MSELISYEPATGEELWRAPFCDVDEQVALAREAFPTWVSRSLSTRIELVRRYANEIRKREDEMAELIAREAGKPLWEAKTEVGAVINKVEISIAAYAERTPQKRLDNGGISGTVALRHKPHGVMAVLGPYNFPAHLANGHIIPALIAGNTIVFKPSEKTPATGAMLVECLHAAGIDENVVRLVIGGPDEGKALVAHDNVDGILFTGSVNTGIAINKKLAARPDKILALEMGGNNPIIAWDTPHLRDAATLIVQSAFTTAGQRCSAASRLIVRDELYDDLMNMVKTIVRSLLIDHPMAEPQPFMGPVIDNVAAQGLMDSFVWLINHGGKPVINLTQADENLPFLSPSIIDVTDMKDRPDIELFGPLLQVVKVSNFEEAIMEANNTRFGLCASLIGGTPDHYKQFWANIRAGIVNWNRPTNGASSKAPFGGVGLSGNHRPSAYYAADYCAYPVVSTEVDQPRASLGIGVRH